MTESEQKESPDRYCIRLAFQLSVGIKTIQQLPENIVSEVIEMMKNNPEN